MLENKERRLNIYLLSSIARTTDNNYFQFSIDVNQSLILLGNILVPITNVEANLEAISPY